jgi:NAD+ synthase
VSSPSVPPLDTELAERVLVRFLRDEAGRAGFTRLVLGLSGGIDSAVSAYLAARAVGPENVISIAMPWKHSSEESLEHGHLVATEGDLSLDHVDLTDAAESLLAQLPEPTPHRVGNVLARLRMITLWDRSFAEQALVVGTTNKTELLVGYGTLHGDLASALNPLGDLYKCQVRDLARHLGVPDVVVDKPPSADLAPGQTDEADFGFTYDEADAVLERMIDRRHAPEDIVAEGFEESLVRAIHGRVVRNQYKRRGPLIAKLSRRTVGWEFRYPRDWRT